MKYDDASWHCGDDFPSDLPREAGGTHIGMFVAWCLLNGLAGEIFTTEFPDLLEQLKSRKMPPGRWFLSTCDEKFTDEDLSDEGNKFAKAYYGMKSGRYINDYLAAVGKGLPTEYYVPDSWDTYDRLAPVVARRFERWRRFRRCWELWRR